MKVKLYITLLVFFLAIPLIINGQNASLANHYYKRGEYEKALNIYEALYEKSHSDYYFTQLVTVLKKLDRYKEAKDLIHKQLEHDPRTLQAYVYLGEIEDVQGYPEKAAENYDKAVQLLRADRSEIVRLANAFSGLGLYKRTIEVMEKGAKLFDDKYMFAYSLAEYCRRVGFKKKMVDYYLLTLEDNPRRLSSVKTLMSRYLDEEDLMLVQKSVYNRISQGVTSEVFSELLSWVAIQREDYKTAFRQLRALDIRKKENGRRVYKIGNIARKAEDYATAIEAFTYIVKNKPENSPFFIPAQMALLNTQVEKINLQSGNQDIALAEIDLAYDSLINVLGENRNSVHLMLDQAQFNAFQIGNVDKAIRILKRIVDMRTVNKRVRAEAKLQLADFLLIRGKKWDATLLYSQVDKEFPEGELGEQARFKNAMLSYYTGDFEWAKEQFDILKAATSRLLSNNAIDMSVFIADNLNLDTTAIPLQMYADAEFLLFQNKHKSALHKLNDLLDYYPDHKLQDDIYYLKGRIYANAKNYSAAIEQYKLVLAEDPEGIRADNSLYNLALIYDNILGDKPKAMKTYERLFMDYKGSTFAVYARKRYRELQKNI